MSTKVIIFINVSKSVTSFHLRSKSIFLIVVTEGHLSDTEIKKVAQSSIDAKMKSGQLAAFFSSV